jgi:hypothetical protein
MKRDVSRDSAAETIERPVGRVQIEAGLAL